MHKKKKKNQPRR